MTAYVALLRAVNVAGTGKLPMADLRAIAQGLGLANVRTYIASGNLLFESALGEDALKHALETKLEAYAGMLESVSGQKVGKVWLYGTETGQLVRISGF